MSNDDLAAQYETLRAAAAEVVHSALKTRHPAPYTPELHALHQMLLAIQSPPTSADAMPGADTVDPARYSLAFTDYRDDGSSGPYELTSLAAEIRAELDGDRIPGQHVPDHPLRDVTMTGLRAMVISSLLKELAARLSPGPAIGTAETGRDLAAIAMEFSKRLENKAEWGD